jgi:predicted DCC family thiol-disulfide oxidoreductase YuxK
VTAAAVREPHSYRSDAAVPAFADDRPVIIFDGYCALCSGTAQFVLRHDRDGAFRLLPAQAPLGHALYLHYGLDPQDYETIILIADGRALFKSDAAIRIAVGLGWPWKLAAVLRVLPRALRDRLYDFVARNRIRFFGRRETCYRPDARFENRFLA